MGKNRSSEDSAAQPARERSSDQSREQKPLSTRGQTSTHMRQVPAGGPLIPKESLAARRLDGSTAEYPDGGGTRIAKPVHGIRSFAMRAHVLEVVKGPDAGRKLSLNVDELTLGRGASAELKLASEEVSRAHAVLTRADDEYTVEDLNSRNGIYLNGLKVHAAVLRDGDELLIGDTVLVYHEGS